MKLKNVVLPSRGCDKTWDIDVVDNIITSIRPTWANNDGTTEEPPSVVLPALCHPHVHLDKAYILTCNHLAPSSHHPDYSDLAPKDGSFQEALRNTAGAKERYTPADLRLRGAQLLATSYRQGVTSVRAFVEVDHVTGTKTLAAASELKRRFAGLVDVQICAFAQDPVFSTDHGDENRLEMERALKEYGDDIDVLGSTPYVETSREASLANIDWAVRTALELGLHLDFHLDYNLGDHPGYSRTDELPLVYAVVCCLQAHRWVARADPAKTVVLGHCTQLTRLTDGELQDLAALIKTYELPIHFVGLPTSDIYMMGRSARETSETDAPEFKSLGEIESQDRATLETHLKRMLSVLRDRQPQSTKSRKEPHSRPRGTLQVPALIKDYGLHACVGVNNMGNTFTPFGTGDPLQLASWGVGLYHSGTPADAELLYECISSRARRAIGLSSKRNEMDLAEGEEWRPMLMLRNEREIKLDVTPGDPLLVSARQRRDFKDVVWDPPEVTLRRII